MSAKKKSGAQKPVTTQPLATPKVQPSVEVTNKVESTNQPKIPIANQIDFFEQLGKYNIFLMLGLLVLLSILVFNNYLFADKPYCFTDIASDSINLSYPYMVNYANYFAEHGLPKWSFHAGMGQSIFPFFLRDPFELLLFFSGRDAVLGGLIYLEITKIIISGLLFYKFLRLINVSHFSSLLGGLFFSFSGFMIMGSAWYGFTYEALCLALFLVAFELLYQKNNWYLLPIVVALIALSMPFNLYVYGLFVAAYAIFRHLYSGDNKSVQKIGGIYLQMIGFGVIGLLLAGPFLLENIYQILESPRVSGTNSLTGKLSALPLFDISGKQELGTSIMRFFSNDILGSAVNFKGWKNILEAGSFYCGLPCLLLMPQVFPFLEKKARNLFLIFIVLWILPIFFPYLRHAFWLFSGDYYRAYAFFVAIVFILYAVYALDFILTHKKINIVVLVVSVVVLAVLVNFPYFENSEAVDGTIKGFVQLLIISYAALLFVIARPTSATYLRYILMGIVVFELSYISGITTNNWAAYEGDKSQKTGYTDYSVDAVNYIKERDKSFYRIDKSYGSSSAVFMSLNDALIQGYYGTSSYNPFNHLNYIYYMQLIGVSDKNVETDSRWCLGLLYKPIMESANHVKYILAKNRINPFWQMVCDSFTKVGDVTVFKNKYALPFGYTFSKYMKESDYEKIGFEQRSMLALRTCVVKDKDLDRVKNLSPYPIGDTTAPFDLNSYGRDVQELGKETMNLTQFSDNLVSGTINLSQDKMVYISIPFDDGWKATVDGKPMDKIILSAGMTGLMLGKGTHQITLTYDLRYFDMGVKMSLCGSILFIVLIFMIRKDKKEKILQNFKVEGQ